MEASQLAARFFTGCPGRAASCHSSTTFPSLCSWYFRRIFATVQRGTKPEGRKSKARGADQVGKRGRSVTPNFQGVERFDVTVGRGVKRNHDRHDFAKAELALPYAGPRRA